MSPIAPPEQDLPRQESPRARVLGLLGIGAIAAVTLGADLATKHFARTHLGGGAKDVVAGVARFVYAENTGAAWSLLHDAPPWIRRPFFVAISVLAVVVIGFVVRRPSELRRKLSWGLALVLGGALGNLHDRLLHGAVVDFVDVYARWGGVEHHWPTFNVADVAIVAGVLLIALDGSKKKKPSSEPMST